MAGPHVPAGFAFTADSRQTEAGRLYDCPAEDNSRTPLQEAIDNAGYEYGFRNTRTSWTTPPRSPLP